MHQFHILYLYNSPIPNFLFCSSGEVTKQTQSFPYFSFCSILSTEREHLITNYCGFHDSGTDVVVIMDIIDKRGRLLNWLT